jgi:hypothetical protein
MKNYDDLVKKYPELFSSEESRAPFPMFGFECDIGWYNIIDNACSAIYSEFSNAKWYLSLIENQLKDIKGCTERRRVVKKDVKEEDVLVELTLEKLKHLEKINEQKDKLPKVLQIKEKFGTLRLYFNRSDEVINAITLFAENLSCTTCEKCGNVGETYRIGWFQTLCPEHAIEKYGKEILNEQES